MSPPSRVGGLGRLGLASLLPIVWFGALALAGKPTQSPRARKLVRLSVQPAIVTLYGSGSTQQLIVTAAYSNGEEEDVTSQAKFRLSVPKVIALGQGPGTIQAVGDGTARVVVTFRGARAVAKATARNSSVKRKLSFTKDIAPILTMGGCTNSNCHGSMHGKAGFKLSLFGYEPALDYKAIVEDTNGRRIDRQNPQQSLILLKPTFSIPHGGGERFKVDSLEYNSLLEWIQSGTPYEADSSPRLVALEVFPKERTFNALAQRQQLVARGTYSDGTAEDLTRKVQYTPDEASVALVDRSGLVTSHGVGETTIMIRTLGKAIVSRVTVVGNPPLANYPNVPTNNYLDALVFRKLKRLNIVPSGLSTDSEFLRRVSLDVIGLTPTEEETEAFLSSKDPKKRGKLIDRLLDRPEYAEVWANRFDDLFRVSGDKGAEKFQDFMIDFLRNNRPYDQFVRGLLTSTGELYQNGPANFYLPVAGSPEQAAVQVSQTLLGVRITCAHCHNHPFEKWTQADFYGFAAFFKHVASKGMYSDGESSIILKTHAELKDPKTKAEVSAKFLDGPEVQDIPDADVREKLADWLTSPSNPWFARSTVNRIWATYLGRGLVVPIDDFRVTNLPSNPDLLDALAKDFVDHQFDFKHVVRTILNSRVYQLSSAANATNRSDTINYSHYYSKRLSAEQLIDSMVQITGVREKFSGSPPEYRAMEIPSGAPSYFLKTFGRPDSRDQICERNNQPDMAQAMHLASGETIESKVRSRRGDLAKWLVDPSITDERITRRIFLRALAREPEPAEREKVKKLMAAAVASGDAVKARREVFQDLMWAVLTSGEFMFNH